MTPRTLLLTTILLLVCSTAFAQAKAPAFAPIVSPKKALHLIKSSPSKGPPVVILDVRGTDAFEQAHLPGAQPISWAEFSATAPSKKGLLFGDKAVLARKLGHIGLSQEATVLVVGDPKSGWGEEGRIVWMLRHLGHPQTALIDGGWHALARAGAPVEKGPAPAPTPATFKVTVDTSASVTLAQVKSMLNADGAQFLDTREAREYSGQTPYGESRGGHLPGAAHLHYKDLLDPKGHILPKASVLAKLRAAGLDPASPKPVVAYCTGGVRSAWVALVLEHYGIKSMNYAGSMWEWAAQDQAAYPLQSSSK